jgi:hypothetical protein
VPRCIRTHSRRQHVDLFATQVTVNISDSLCHVEVAFPPTPIRRLPAACPTLKGWAIRCREDVRPRQPSHPNLLLHELLYTLAFRRRAHLDSSATFWRNISSQCIGSTPGISFPNINVSPTFSNSLPKTSSTSRCLSQECAPVCQQSVRRGRRHQQRSILLEAIQVMFYKGTTKERE